MSQSFILIKSSAGGLADVKGALTFDLWPVQECKSREQEGGEVERWRYHELAAPRSLRQQGGLHGNLGLSDFQDV